MPCYATLSMASLGEEEVVMKLKTYIYTLFMSLGISDERCCWSGSVSSIHRVVSVCCTRGVKIEIMWWCVSRLAS
jgi:hypothetical protein